MAFSEQDRVQIRRFLGFSSIFIQADLRLELAIGAIQSLSEPPGVRPDSNSENYVKGLIYGIAAQPGPSGVTLGPTAQNITWSMPAQPGLVQIKAQIDGLIPITFVLSADKGDAVIDPARGKQILRSIGREKVTEMCAVLATSRRMDIFDDGDVNPSGDTFYNLPDGRGSKYRW